MGKKKKVWESMLTRGKQKEKGFLQVALILLTSFIVFFYSFEDLWEYKIHALYLVTGFIGVFIVAGCMIYGRKYRNYDTCLWFLFFFFGLISTLYNQGISLEYVLSHFVCVWSAFLAMYYSVQAADDPHKLITIMCGVSSIPLSALCICALIKASRDLLLEYPVHDKTYGCFQLGRLCASGNANALGIAAATLVIVAGTCLLYDKGILRIVFGLLVALGWFCIGLTGCRTVMVGIAFTAGIFVLLVLCRDRRFLKTDKKALRLTVALTGAVLLFFVVLKSFLIPMNIYRFSMRTYGNLTDQEFLLSNLEKLVVRRISDDDGTFSDRAVIWKSCMEQSIKSAGRFLLGISPLSKEVIKDVYAGRHDIDTSHAHNIYIEILRKHGILGLLTIIMLISSWVKNGIKILLGRNERAYIQFLIAASYGILLMGMTEPVPFSYISCCYASVPFFITCGYVYAVGN
ncbi:O-antigen ligase family protein [Butyrivibrio sp. JL13D10]|uniref:O-antigen ligase family protein n=1 Tax=Butyrivibrio sp. JL13D10 TaxID=3236815 RepID=UPI0038B4EE7C